MTFTLGDLTRSTSTRADPHEGSAAFRYCIHRGAREIGGSCVELAAQGRSILLDLGQPLDMTEVSPDSLPPVAGLSGLNPNLLGIILSHSHRDHWGLIPQARPDLPVVMGTTTHRMMKAAVPWVPRASVPSLVVTMADRVPFDLWPFRITPYTVDHSAYDAYALLVEACGRRLFYSGDLRGHGRKGSVFEKLVRDPPSRVHTLLLEGTTLARVDTEGGFPSEVDIEERLATAFEATRGLALVCASAQNIDRMVSIYKAARRTGRTLLIDVYAAEMLHATGNPRIPKSFWSGIELYVPQYQRRQIKDKGLFAELHRHKRNRIFPEDLKARAPTSVMLFRPAMLNDLVKANCIDGAGAVWSQWDGYLKQKSGLALMARFERLGIPLTSIHTSGHASLFDLRRLAKAIRPERLVPIHSFESSLYPRYFDNVAASADGDWRGV